MKDVVESQWVVRCVNRLPNLALLGHQILSLLLNFIELLCGQTEDRDSCKANEVCISVIFDHERTMVDDRSAAESLNYERLILASAIIFYSYLNDAVLNQIESVRCFILLT